MKRILFSLLPFLILFTIACESNQQNVQQEWAIALHGGAGVISKDLPDSTRDLYFEGLEAALIIGEEILSNGGSALDAVEMVVRALENNPLFNAGKGSVFTNEGTHELDAAIMDGSTLEAGALTGLTTVRHPISLARIVMEESRHIFFSGSGAERYADETEVERVENDWFFTEHRHQQWLRAQNREAFFESPDPLADVDEWKYGTVGAVALDRNGKLAAGTSTGGMTNKMYGRVGDVPIIGSGTYANNLVAISGTGWGEQIMRNVSAYTIASYMEFKNTSLDAAMDFLLTKRLNPDDAGFIAVDKYGNVSMKMNTAGMFRAGANSNGYRNVAIWEDGYR